MDHVDVLGRSIADPLVQAYLDEQERADPADFRQNAGSGSFGGPHGGFALRSEPLLRYLAQHEAARSRALPDEDERIVLQLSFMGADALDGEQRAYLSALPFGLTFGQEADAVARTLGAAPSSDGASDVLPDRTAVRSAQSYRVEPTMVGVTYDGARRLMAVYLSPVDKATRQADRRLASTRIVEAAPGTLDAVEAWRAQFPTSRWREAMDEGADYFTEPYIAEAERLLDAFVDAVKRAAAGGREADIYAAVRSLILGLNDFNERTGVIETLERDELGVFIDDVVKAAGVEIPEDEDITMPWRDW